MRINNNINATSFNHYATNNKALQKTSEKLASGRKVNRAADNAAILAIAEKMMGQIKGMNKGMNNIQDGTSLVQTAEGALSESHNIVQRMSELAIQANNGIYSDDDRAALDAEFQQLKTELDDIADKTTFNGKGVIDGSFSESTGEAMVIQSGANMGDETAVSIDRMDSASLGLSGLSIASQGGAKDAIKALGDAVNTISTQRGALGATQNRLEHKYSNLMTSEANLEEAESRMRDTDYARAMMDRTAQRIRQQANISIMAQGNLTAGNVLKLFG